MPWSGIRSCSQSTFRFYCVAIFCFGLLLALVHPVAPVFYRSGYQPQRARRRHSTYEGITTARREYDLGKNRGFLSPDVLQVSSSRNDGKMPVFPHVPRSRPSEVIFPAQRRVIATATYDYKGTTHTASILDQGSLLSDEAFPGRVFGGTRAWICAVKELSDARARLVRSSTLRLSGDDDRPTPPAAGVHPLRRCDTLIDWAELLASLAAQERADAAAVGDGLCDDGDVDSAVGDDG